MTISFKKCELRKIVKQFRSIVQQMEAVKTKRGMITKLKDLELTAFEWSLYLDKERLGGTFDI